MSFSISRCHAKAELVGNRSESVPTAGQSPPGFSPLGETQGAEPGAGIAEQKPASSAGTSKAIRVTPMRADVEAALSRDGYPTDPRSLYARTLEDFAKRRAEKLAAFEAASRRANERVEAQGSLNGPGRRRMPPLNGLNADPVDALVHALPNRFAPTAPTLD